MNEDVLVPGFFSKKFQSGDAGDSGGGFDDGKGDINGQAKHHTSRQELTILTAWRCCRCYDL